MRRLASCFFIAGYVALGPAASQTIAGPSDETKRFIAVALSANGWISEAANIALASGAKPSLQRFARSALTEQSHVRGQLAQWESIVLPVPAGAIVYERPFEYGPIGLLFLPLNATVAVTSLAVNGAIGAIGGGAYVSSDMPDKVERLKTLTGSDFDKAYASSQENAYVSLLAAYKRYVTAGDDEAVRKVARSEMPVLQRQLVAVRALE